MVKQINVYFEDNEHKKLVAKKKNLTWHDFILKLIQSKGNEDNK